MIEVASTIALALLSVSAAMFLFRMLRSRSTADRVVAIDAVLLALVSSIAVQAARTGDATYLNVMVVTALLAFVGTTLVAWYISRRGV